MNVSYPAVFFKEDSGYSVVFPDLNHLSTCGDTLDEACALAVDCLAGYLYTCKMYDIEVDPASSRDGIDPAKLAKDFETETEGAFVNIVTVDVDAYAKAHFEKSVKKTLSIPVWLNNLAVEQDINFSKVLQEALKRKLGIARN